MKNINRTTLGSMMSHPERFLEKKVFIVFRALPPDMGKSF
jgi:hypothetical protein